MHAHLLLQINNGPSLSTMEKAYSVNSGDSEVEEAQREILEYATNVLGLSATHPNEDPKQWPGPYGANVNRLRGAFSATMAFSSESRDFPPLHWGHVLCLDGFSVSFLSLQQSQSSSYQPLTDKHKDKEGTFICRFRFPFHYHGYEPLFDELEDNLEQVIRTRRCKFHRWKIDIRHLGSQHRRKTCAVLQAGARLQCPVCCSVSDCYRQSQ